MKTNKTAVCLLTALAAFPLLAAYTVRVNVWRGETFTRIFPDCAEVGPAPEGLSLKIGIAEPVRYLDRPDGTHYQYVADRVVWGSESVGLRVLSVTAAPDMKPGTYRCGTVEVTVLDRTLPPPKDWKYSLDLWQHPWAVARWLGVKPFSRDHYAAMRPLWEMLADAGQKALTVTILDAPWNHQCYDVYGSMVRHIRRTDGSWTFDYSVFDEYVAFGRSCGIGPDIACYTMCPWEYEAAWETEDGKTERAKLLPGTPAFEDYWGAFLADFRKHVAEKGWLGDVYIAMDERSPQDVMNIARLVQARGPGLKISLAGNRPPSEFAGIELHNCCFGLGHLTDGLLAEAASRRAKDMRTTYYVCCGPARPNTFCMSEIEEAFWLGAYPAMCGLDGFLRWAWNSWPRNPLVDASYQRSPGSWKAGDTFLVYPDGSPSLRFLELRNGIVAAEKVRILRESGALDEAAFAKVAALYDRKRATHGEVHFPSIRRDTQRLVNAGAK